MYKIIIVLCFIIVLFITLSIKHAPNNVNYDKNLGKNIEIIIDENWEKDIELWISFPPVTDEEQRAFSKLHLDNLGVKSIRIGEDWTFRESIKWEFNWNPLDKRLTWAKENNYSIFLTVQARWPDWACSDIINEQSCVFKDTDNFEKYIKELARRSNGMIDYVQFWNEWQSDYWYAGTPEQYIKAQNTVYTLFKEYSPETQVALWWFTTVSLRALAACNGAVKEVYADDGIILKGENLEKICKSNTAIKDLTKIKTVLTEANYDIIDFHLYDDYSKWGIYIDNFKELYKTIYKDATFIITEFGGPNLYVVQYSDRLQAADLQKYIETLNELWIEKAYYFSLIEPLNNPVHIKSWLITETLELKESYDLFQEMNKPNQ